LGQVPDVVVDTDGNIYTPDFSFATPTMIQKVVVRNVGPNGAARILDAMRAAGLDQPGDDGGVVADTGVTVFTAVIDGQEIVNKIAMSGPGPQPDISPHPGVGLLARLQDPAETWGAADVQPATFTPTAYRIYLADSLADGTGIEWPLAISVDDFGQPSVPNFDVDGLRAGVVFGDDAQKITDAFGDQPEGSYVQGANGLVAIWIRPLLPPEIA
jgi:hypothetical protein